MYSLLREGKAGVYESKKKQYIRTKMAARRPLVCFFSFVVPRLFVASLGRCALRLSGLLCSSPLPSHTVHVCILSRFTFHLSSSSSPNP